MSRIFLSLFIVLSLTGIQARSPEISPSAKVYLFNAGPDRTDITSIWGHGALWIVDETTGLDKIYNYGVPAFEGYFNTRLLGGRLIFYLENRHTYKQDLEGYIHSKREVSLHEINLTFSEKKKLFQLLEDNARPENRMYLYEYFRENCTTKIFDLLSEIIEGQIVFRQDMTDITYRDIFDEYLKYAHFYRYFVRFVAGMKNDRHLTTEELFFMPEMMVDHLSQAVISGPGGTRPFIIENKVVYSQPEQRDQVKMPFNPLIVALILLALELIIFLVSWFRKRNISRVYDHFWFLIFGVLGLFLVYMTFFTYYYITKLNLNLLWANPLLLGAFMIPEKWKPLLFRILAVCLLLVVPGFLVLPQNMYPEFIILAAILLLKVLKYGFLRNHFYKAESMENAK